MNLSIIIPSRNEGEELFNTTQSIFKFADCEVIVVNDCSDSDKWFDPVGECRVIHSKIPIGFAGAIQKGIEAATNENIWICGARTRFTEGFAEKAIEALENEPETLFCIQSAVLRYDQTEIKKSTSTLYGAKIRYYKPGNVMRFLVNIPVKKPCSGEVDCAYGGSYILKKSLWKKIHGLNGIQTRGGCNQFLSLKTWLSGGKVKILDQLIGNIYRAQTSYPVGYAEILYNRLYILYVLFGERAARNALLNFKDINEYPLIRCAYYNNIEFFKKESAYLLSIKKRNIDQFVKP
jgi:glycosyltransferase involved in cell wall biosynthesis